VDFSYSGYLGRELCRITYLERDVRSKLMGASSGVEDGGSGGEAALKLKHILLLDVQWILQICSFF